MRKRLLVVGLSALALVACRTAPEQQATPEQQLKDSFVKQIASNGIVRDFQQKGDEYFLPRSTGEHPDAKWRVHVDSASIERGADGTTPVKGLLKSSWYADGEQIRPRGDQSDLPLAFLDQGIAQECWALWDKSKNQWSWK